MYTEIQDGTNDMSYEPQSATPSERRTRCGMPQASIKSSIDMEIASLGMAIVKK